MRTVETKRRDRLVSHEQHARPGVMCGHVNWRVIDEQITWRSIRQRMLGTSAFRAPARTSEREGARARGREKKIAAFLVLADIRAIGRFLARLRRQEFHLQPFDVEAARQGLERTLLLITTLPSPRATFAR